MAFTRRLYYLKTDGTVLSSFMMNGSFVPHGQDWDFQYDGALQPFADKRSEVGMFEWTEPDTEIEREFGAAYGVSVDVTVDPPQLVFDHDPPPPQPEPPSDVDELLNIIKGVTE